MFWEQILKCSRAVVRYIHVLMIRGHEMAIFLIIDYMQKIISCYALLRHTIERA